MEVHSQTEYPYVSFMGETLPNHAYVNLSLVGNDTSDGIQCHTDIPSCCSRDWGIFDGDWIPPGREYKLPFANNASADIYEVRGAQRVDLRCRNADVPSGIYRCDITTIYNVIYDNNDNSVRESVYVGLYASGGMHYSIH